MTSTPNNPGCQAEVLRDALKSLRQSHEVNGHGLTVAQLLIIDDALASVPPAQESKLAVSLRRDQIVALISSSSKNSADHDIAFGYRVLNAAQIESRMDFNLATTLSTSPGEQP